MNPHAEHLTWRTSSYSGTEANCVQIASDGPRTHIRDSKNPTGDVLTFSAAAIATFLDAASRS